MDSFDQNKGKELRSLRIDKWLLSARFFKTRALSFSAVNRGKVRVNGYRVRPSREICVGDRVSIIRGGNEYVIEVLVIERQRRPARDVADMYREIK